VSKVGWIERVQTKVKVFGHSRTREIPEGLFSRFTLQERTVDDQAIGARDELLEEGGVGVDDRCQGLVDPR